MKILIIDDHQIVRQGLKEIIGHIPEIRLIDEAKNGIEALNLTSMETYDLILLDISLPDSNGLEVLQTLLSRNPDQKVLMLSMHSEEQYAIRALRSGASGYLTKDTAADELKNAILKINSGGKYISSLLAEKIVMQIGNNSQDPDHEKLSAREFAIMLKIASGKPLNQIGNELCISGKTVSTYRSRLLEKMAMKSNADITYYCIKNGLME